MDSSADCKESAVCVICLNEKTWFLVIPHAANWIVAGGWWIPNGGRLVWLVTHSFARCQGSWLSRMTAVESRPGTILIRGNERVELFSTRMVRKSFARRTGQAVKQSTIRTCNSARPVRIRLDLGQATLANAPRSWQTSSKILWNSASVLK